MSLAISIKKQVFERAKGRCEYCLINEKFSPYSHEIDHIIPHKHGGNNELKNLALSCLSCNRHKGADFATIKPETNEIIPLFNPRRNKWSDHFTVENGKIIGLTEIGKATTKLLQMNNETKIIQRQLLSKKGFYP